jgi:hypothetical protein
MIPGDVDSGRQIDTVPVPRIEFQPFSTTPLEELLKLKTPPFTETLFRQLRYIERYLRHEDLNCQSVAIERHYIDRDYIEDYSVFYSRCLGPYPNSCQRVHFFSCTENVLKAKLQDLIKLGRDGGITGYKLYQAACAKFSSDVYLGFSVIRPLDGSPVGRTVIRALSEKAGNGLTRSFKATRTYRAHLAGVELVVEGLGFQQQDSGVSACATTAIWMALQKSRDFEDIGYATPAQITSFASRNVMPNGRPLPAEGGLSVDQMCQAISGLGMSPYLVTAGRYPLARNNLYSALNSGFATILVLRSIDKDRDDHAVTAVGMKLSDEAPKPSSGLVISAADRLQCIYLHDDRNGPYLRAFLESGDSEKCRILIELDENEKISRRDRDWELTHILLPIHPKIRLSFASLGRCAVYIVDDAAKIIDKLIDDLKDNVDIEIFKDLYITYETIIQRAHVYVEDLLLGRGRPPLNNPDPFLDKVMLSRYVGIIRLQAKHFGCIEVLIDTTSTWRNIRIISVVGSGEPKFFTKALIDLLAKKYKCSPL